MLGVAQYYADKGFEERPALRRRPHRALLTVIIPAYNESATAGVLLQRVLAASYEKQVIIVDDGSRDDTAEVAERWLAGWMMERHAVLRHSHNRGKGAAIRTGLEHARGDVTIIQDADLEYDPQDYAALIEPIRRGEADVVYGSRAAASRSAGQWSAHRLCRSLLNSAVCLLYGRRISDEATCYKVFRTDLLRRLDLRCERFEFCPEVTAKLCRLGIPIHEVPISYRPRSAAEGKKIGWRDAVQAFWTLLWWRFAPVKLLDPPAVESVELAASMHEVAV